MVGMACVWGCFSKPNKRKHSACLLRISLPGSGHMSAGFQSPCRLFPAKVSSDRATCHLFNTSFFPPYSLPGEKSFLFAHLGGLGQEEEQKQPSWCRGRGGQRERTPGEEEREDMEGRRRGKTRLQTQLLPLLSEPVTQHTHTHRLPS